MMMGSVATQAGYVGHTSFFPGLAAQIPASHLPCDGAAVSRTTYVALFTAIGTIHGVGDGSTTFNLPDLRGRAPVGMDNMGTAAGAADRITAAWADTEGGSGGAETHTLDTTEIPAHTHNVQTRNSSGAGTTRIQQATDGAASDTATESTGGGGAHNNLQPALAGYWIIQF
jgi:microcystin-dependent protein